MRHDAPPSQMTVSSIGIETTTGTMRITVDVRFERPPGAPLTGILGSGSKPAGPGPAGRAGPGDRRSNQPARMLVPYRMSVVLQSKENTSLCGENPAAGTDRLLSQSG